MRPMWYAVDGRGCADTQLSSVTLVLAVTKTAVLFVFIEPLWAVGVAFSNVVATVRKCKTNIADTQMMLWLVFATTVRSRPAPYMHPFLLPASMRKWP